MSGEAVLRGQFDDRTKRAYDAAVLATLSQDGWVNKWLAIRLSDGSCDGKLYDRKRDAVRHQLHPKQCAYLCLPPDGVSLRGVDRYLGFIEGLYEAGADLADPDTHIPQPQNPEVDKYIIRAVKRGPGGSQA